ncbi:MAG: BON domain-containing protein [Alphaproteobacteria bacterium]|nr:BON domain-containing protein [Alphaproteobacteria bacterium]
MAVEKSKLLFIMSSACSLLFLSSCDPVSWAIGGTAVAGAEVARNQKGLGGAASDTALQAEINKFLFDNDRDIFDRVELSIKHGKVVVIGYMKDKDQCVRAIELVKKAGGAQAIFDETSIGDLPDAKDLFADSGITSRIKSAMLFDGNIQSLNYDITTVKGVVYICGTAQSEYERDLVINCARNTSSVIKVVAYISINKDGAQ